MKLGSSHKTRRTSPHAQHSLSGFCHGTGTPAGHRPRAGQAGSRTDPHPDDAGRGDLATAGSLQPGGDRRSVSESVLDQYLATLDPDRSHFLASDVQQFQQWRHQLDDQILRGETDAAFAIFNRYQERRRQRLDYLIGTLEDPHNSWNFNRDETLQSDRSKAEWIETDASCASSGASN